MPSLQQNNASIMVHGLECVYQNTRKFICVAVFVLHSKKVDSLRSVPDQNLCKASNQSIDSIICAKRPQQGVIQMMSCKVSISLLGVTAKLPV